jgi:hypothetical protein
MWRSSRHGGRCAAAFSMSFLQALEIYPPDVQKETGSGIGFHSRRSSVRMSLSRLFLAGCSPAAPSSASRPESACYVLNRRPSTLQRMATCLKFFRLTSGVQSRGWIDSAIYREASGRRRRVASYPPCQGGWAKDQGSDPDETHPACDCKMP